MEGLIFGSLFQLSRGVEMSLAMGQYWPVGELIGELQRLEAAESCVDMCEPPLIEMIIYFLKVIYSFLKFILRQREAQIKDS